MYTSYECLKKSTFYGHPASLFSQIARWQFTNGITDDINVISVIWYFFSWICWMRSWNCSITGFQCVQTVMYYSSYLFNKIKLYRISNLNIEKIKQYNKSRNYWNTS